MNVCGISLESLHLHLPAELSSLHRAPGAPGSGVPPVHRAATARQAGAGQGKELSRPWGPLSASLGHNLTGLASRGASGCSVLWERSLLNF